MSMSWQTKDAEGFDNPLCAMCRKNEAGYLDPLCSSCRTDLDLLSEHRKVSFIEAVGRTAFRCSVGLLIVVAVIQYAKWRRWM